MEKEGNVNQTEEDFYQEAKIYKAHKRQFKYFYSNSNSIRLNLKRLIDSISPFEIFKKKGTWIYVACMPKSGSTYITQKLVSITGFQFGRFISYFLDMEQNIDLNMIPKFYNKNIVCQMHTPGKLFNIELMKKFNIKPVILIRDPRDWVLSVHDHLFREPPLFPCGRIIPEWFEFEYKERIKYLIYHFLPSIVAWIRSWLENKYHIEHIVVNYEDLLISNKTKYNLFKKILNFYNLDRYIENLKEKIDKDTQNQIRRKNVARLNRWKSEMDSEHLELFDKITGNLIELLGYEK